MSTVQRIGLIVFLLVLGQATVEIARYGRVQDWRLTVCLVIAATMVIVPSKEPRDD